MGYALESGALFMAFVDDEIVFVLFIVVRLPLQQSSPFLKGQRRIGICRWDTSYGR